MAFKLFTPLFEKFDTATADYVTNISTKLIAALTPVLSVGLTIGFIIYALAIIRGAIETPVNDFLWRSFRIGVIVSIATAGGLYQSSIADAIIATPDALASALVAGDAVNTSTAGGLLDSTAGAAFDVAANQFEKASIFSKQGFMYTLYALIILVSTAILVSIGGAFLIMAKVALAILVGLGPLFIFGLLWQSTSRFFEVWTSQVINYGLLIVLTSTLFIFLMGIYGNYMSAITPDSSSFNAIYTLAGAVIITIVSGIILLQLPSIAGALAGGVGLSYMWEARLVSRGAGKAAQGGKAAAGAAKRGGAAAARGGAAVAGRAARAVAGYARGAGR